MTSVLGPEHQDQRRRHRAVGVARQHLGLVDGLEHGLVPGGHAAGFAQLATHDGAVGGQSHFHLGHRVVRQVVGEDDVGLDARLDAPTVAGRRPGRTQGGARGAGPPAGACHAGHAFEVVGALGLDALGVGCFGVLLAFGVGFGGAALVGLGLLLLAFQVFLALQLILAFLFGGLFCGFLGLALLLQGFFFFELFLLLALFLLLRLLLELTLVLALFFLDFLALAFFLEGDLGVLERVIRGGRRLDRRRRCGLGLDDLLGRGGWRRGGGGGSTARGAASCGTADHNSASATVFSAS